jgi:hypothetical protein
METSLVHLTCLRAHLVLDCLGRLSFKIAFLVGVFAAVCLASMHVDVGHFSCFLVKESLGGLHLVVNVLGGLVEGFNFFAFLVELLGVFLRRKLVGCLSFSVDLSEARSRLCGWAVIDRVSCVLQMKDVSDSVS